MSSSFSDWKEIRIGLPQGSDLGPLLFNVFINYIFLFLRYNNICNNANDTTIFACNPVLEIIVRQLESYGTVVAKWFSDNYLKPNDDKCHLMIFRDNCSRATVTIGNSSIDESDYGKLLGVTFDKKLSFKPRPNALDFSLYNARHSCIVKFRERLATLSSEVERVLLCRVKFDQSQIVERCRVLSRAFGNPTRLSRAHARAVAAVFHIIGKPVLVNNIETPKALLYHWFLLSSSNTEAK